jgi:DNA invertase Pin-like site-specific DNA recombinase
MSDSAYYQTKRAAIYTRVSTARQGDDGTSLDTQEARCRDYVAENGYELVGVWSDQYSGALYRERPGLSELRAVISRRRDRRTDSLRG